MIFLIYRSSSSHGVPASEEIGQFTVMTDDKVGSDTSNGACGREDARL